MCETGRSGMIRILAGGGLLALMLLPLMALPFTVLPAAAFAAGEKMDYPVICTAPPGADGEQVSRICGGFMTALRASYPEESFRAGAGPVRPEGPGLEVVILRAGASTASLRLIFTDPQGLRREGQVQSVASMDRGLSEALMQSLYLRSIAALAMFD